MRKRSKPHHAHSAPEFPLRQPWEVWGIGLAFVLVAVVGLGHAGVNLSGSLAGFVRDSVHALDTRLLP